MSFAQSTILYHRLHSTSTMLFHPTKHQDSRAMINWMCMLLWKTLRFWNIARLLIMNPDIYLQESIRIIRSFGKRIGARSGMMDVRCVILLL